MDFTVTFLKWKFIEMSLLTGTHIQKSLIIAPFDRQNSWKNAK